MCIIRKQPYQGDSREGIGLNCAGDGDSEEAIGLAKTCVEENIVVRIPDVAVTDGAPEADLVVDSSA